MTWLVTGGAGYIGSHVVRALRDADMPVVVLDDLSSGFEQFVPAGVPFERGTLLDRPRRGGASRHDVTGVIHVAGFKYAGVSVERPLHTYEQNISAMLTLLDAMQDGASTTGVLLLGRGLRHAGRRPGDRETRRCRSRPTARPSSIGEWLLRDLGRAGGLQHTSLRYFNVVGSGSDESSTPAPHNLFPLVFDMLYRGDTPRINGDDYPTPDGTCVRDYIHVADLALAHVAAAPRLEAGEPVERVYNLGSGDGTRSARS